VKIYTVPQRLGSGQAGRCRKVSSTLIYFGQCELKVKGEDFRNGRISHLCSVQRPFIDLYGDADAIFFDNMVVREHRIILHNGRIATLPCGIIEKRFDVNRPHARRIPRDINVGTQAGNGIAMCASGDAMESHGIAFGTIRAADITRQDVKPHIHAEDCADRHLGKIGA